MLIIYWYFFIDIGWSFSIEIFHFFINIIFIYIVLIYIISSPLSSLFSFSSFSFFFLFIICHFIVIFFFFAFLRHWLLRHFFFRYFFFHYAIFHYVIIFMPLRHFHFEYFIDIDENIEYFDYFHWYFHIYWYWFHFLSLFSSLFSPFLLLRFLHITPLSLSSISLILLPFHFRHFIITPLMFCWCRYYYVDIAAADDMILIIILMMPDYFFFFFMSLLLFFRLIMPFSILITLITRYAMLLPYALPLMITRWCWLLFFATAPCCRCRCCRCFRWFSLLRRFLSSLHCLFISSFSLPPAFFLLSISFRYCHFLSLSLLIIGLSLIFHFRHFRYHFRWLLFSFSYWYFHIIDNIFIDIYFH